MKNPLRSLVQLVQGVPQKILKLYKPLTKDEDIGHRIVTLFAFGVAYLCLYLAYFVLVILFIDRYETGGSGIASTLIASVYAFRVLPFLIVAFPFLRIVKYASKRGFLPKGIIWLLTGFLATRIIPRFLDEFFPLGYISVFGVTVFDVVLDVLTFIGRTLPVIGGVWLVLNYRNIKRKANIGTAEPPDISKAVHSVLDSEEFLTALRSTLPKGEKDKEYGLDYIPYMLEDNDKRLEELKTTTRIYFFLTLGVGVFTTVVVVYFGYLLVNEEAAGLPKNVAEINQKLEQVNGDLPVVFSSELGDYQRRSALRSPTLNSLRSQSDAYVSQNNEADRIAEAVSSAVSEALETEDWNALSDALQSNLSELRDVSTDISEPAQRENLQGYIDILDESTEAVNEFVRSKEYALLSMIRVTEDLQELIGEVEDSVGSEDARTAELIKRLGLSLIVASFLLAVLKYTSNIYKEHYQDMRRVQYEAQIIRRFYIALKSSFKAEEGSTPNKIIADFVNGSQVVYKKDESSATTDMSNSLNADFIKELISAMSKKS